MAKKDKKAAAEEAAPSGPPPTPRLQERYQQQVLPELAKGMGQAAKEFRSGLNDEHEPEKDKTEAAPAALAVEATPAEVLPVEAAVTPPVETAPVTNN